MTPQTSPSFNGFREDRMALIRLPDAFFTQLMPLIDDLTQLRLLLYMFWHLEKQENKIRYFRLDDLATDPVLIRMTGGEEALEQALKRLVALKAVLEAKLDWMDETYFFINGPQGRAAVEAINKDEWQDADQVRHPIHMTQEQPNIFKLYEENIGPITPMMAEILKDDEITYPAAWINEAVEIAVTRNARNWKFVQAILKRWQKEGRGNEQNRRDNSQDPSIYRKKWLGED